MIIIIIKRNYQILFREHWFLVTVYVNLAWVMVYINRLLKLICFAQSSDEMVDNFVFGSDIKETLGMLRDLRKA